MPSATHVTSSYDNVDRNAYTTASVSPTADRWLVLDVYSRENLTGPTVPTVTDSALALAVEWTQEHSKMDAAGDHRVTRFYARTSGTPGSGTITMDYSGVTQVGSAWILSELSSDVDASDPFVQSNSVEGLSTSATVSLSAFGSGDNRPLVCCFHRTNEAAAPEAGYTEIADVFGTTPDAGFAVAYHGSATDTSVTYSWTTAATPSLAIASEIKAAAGGGAANVFDLGWVM